MNDLKIINLGNKLMVDSREVAEMVDRQHNELMKSIRLYCDYLGQGNIAQSDFFAESTYTNAQNKEQPCYLLTRKGCDMVANKMTGEKGVLFTATYVTKFEEMEKQLTQPKLPTTYLEALEALVASEKEKQILLPKAQYFDALVERNLLMNFRDTAKELKIKEKEFIKWLIEKKYVYRNLKGNLKPFARHTPKLFEIKEQINGEWAGNQTLITPRGRETFRLLLSQVKATELVMV